LDYRVPIVKTLQLALICRVVVIEIL